MNSNENILIIDDDYELSEMISDYLKTENLSLTIANSGETGLNLFQKQNFDLIILDIMLPGINGIDVLKKIRINNNIPIIMLTARGDDVDRIIGLEYGADDYLPKPFNPRELVARIKAILRRTQVQPNEKRKLELGEIKLDTAKRKVTVNNNILNLTGTEYAILKCLLETPGEVVDKETLSKKALGRRLLPYDRSIDTHISNLRGKLENAGHKQKPIHNERGIGYILLPG